MKTSKAISFFVSFRGTVGRIDFFLAGLVLAIVKFAADTLVAGSLFHRPWYMHYYLSHEQVLLALRADAGDRTFFLSMLCVSIPFVWFGVALCAKRLRAAGMPVWLASLFFVPLLNLVLFVVLCIVPQETVGQRTRGAATALNARRWLWCGNVCVTYVFTSAIALLWSGFSVYTLARYGAGLFVGLPFCTSLIAVVVHNLRTMQSDASSLFVGLSCTLVVLILMLILGFEGAGCLIMAAPIWLTCAIAGSLVGIACRRDLDSRRIATLLLLVLVFLVPILMGAEHAAAPEPTVFSVRTRLRIDAPAADVWSRVISFPEIPEPDDWVFLTGVAYPVGARIEGRGPGATRYCDFSTGSFVEPIEVWDEPELLRFSVTECPPPMREWSPYENVHPPHLEGFMQSRAGQFRLTPVGASGTWLEGTTWYAHHMAPEFYWRVWADFLVHRIHRRVLTHIQGLCENGPPATEQ